MSSILFFQLLISAIDIAIFLVALDSNIVFNIGGVVAFVGLLNVIVPLFIYCKLSENITTDLFATGDIFFECVWYRLPIKQQKIFFHPIQRGQREFRLMGLGISECSLNILSSVCGDFVA